MSESNAPSIPPLAQNDLPERKRSFWRMTGPGAIMVGLSVGSGELVLWPWITAKFGADMVWAAALGVFLQMWINLEIGRWAIATGESAMTGFARASRVAIYFFLTLLIIQALLPGWARATGSAFKALFFGIDGPGADWMWTAFVFFLIAVLLFGPKRIYSTVEISIGLMVILIVGGMMYLAVRVGTWSDAGVLAKGLLNVGHIEFDDEFTPLRFFGAVVFAGAGGFGNLFYAYYLRDKGIGMGARIPMLINPLRGTEERGNETGFSFPESDRNSSRFRDWYAYVRQDSILYFWLLNTFTMFLFMFGALVVLHPQGIVPAEGRLVWDLSQMLETSMGTGGRYLFLLIGMAALFSSQLTIVDGSVRLWTDILHTNFPASRRYTQSQRYFVIAIALMVIGTISTWFFDTFKVSALDFLFLNAVSNGFAMAVYVPLILYINLKFLPKSARPKPLNILFVCLGASVYISFAIYTVAAKVISLF